MDLPIPDAVRGLRVEILENIEYHGPPAKIEKRFLDPDGDKA